MGLDVTKQNGDSACTFKLSKGPTTCLTNLGFSPLSQLSLLLVALKATASARLLALALVASSAKQSATTTASKAHLLVASLVRSLATLPVAKTNRLRLDNFERRQSNTLAAFSRLKDCI